MPNPIPQLQAIHYWRMTTPIYQRYRHLMDQLDTAAPETDLYEALKDELQSLPGYPREARPDDLVKPVLIQTVRA